MAGDPGRPHLVRPAPRRAHPGDRDHPGRGGLRGARDRARDPCGDRGEPDEAPAGRADAGPARGAVRGPGGRRLRTLQRRAARNGARLRPGLRHRQGGRAAGGPARRRTGRPIECAGLPGRPRRGQDRPRRPGRRGPAAAAQAGGARGDLRGVPVVERGPGRLREACGRTPAHSVRGRRADGARRGRPAALRVPPRRTVRARTAPPRVHRRGAGGAGTAVGAGSAAPSDVRARLLAGVDDWLAKPAD